MWNVKCRDECVQRAGVVLSENSRPTLQTVDASFTWRTERRGSSCSRVGMGQSRVAKERKSGREQLSIEV